MTGVSSTALQAKVPSTKSKVVCVNLNCGQTRHTIENCYWPGGGKEGQFSANFRNCARHTSNNISTTPTANLASTVNPLPTPPHTTYALVVSQYSPAALYNEHSDMIDAYLSSSALALKANAVIYTYADSGGSDHCFVDQAMFKNYEQYPMPRRGQVADRGGSFTIVGQGTVKKMVKKWEYLVRTCLPFSATHT